MAAASQSLANTTAPSAGPAGPGGCGQPSNSGAGGKGPSRRGGSADGEAGREPRAGDAPLRSAEHSDDFMMNVYKLKLCPRK